MMKVKRRIGDEMSEGFFILMLEELVEIEWIYNDDRVETLYEEMLDEYYGG